MSVFRVHKSKDFTVMSNAHFRDRNLSLKAKGLLSLMLSLPDDWDYSIAGLVAICTENETAIKSALKELKENGYVVVKKENPTKTNGGRMKYTYEVYENPICANQDTQKQGVEILGVENQGQLNTKVSITKELNTYAFTESYDSEKGTLCSLTSVSEDTREEEKRYPIEDVPYLIKKYADRNIRETRLKDLSDIIVYFIDVYDKNSNTEHMSVSETAIKNIIDAYINGRGKVKDADVWEYKEIINDYFATNYKMDGRPIVKSLQHFFSGKIRENLYLKMI